MIFNLFKSKPSLKELIPNGFVDIHSHILPGIDDGAKDIGESVELIKKMNEMGFSKIIATPHIFPGVYNNNSSTIKKTFETLKKHIKKDIIIDFSAEYMIDKSIIKLIDDNDLLCMKKKYILIEQSFISPSQSIFELIFRLRLKNYIPILAHPERYIYYYDDFKQFYKLKNVGALFQINLLSLTGYHGKVCLKIVKKLLKNKMVNFVGSDIHNLNHIEKFDNKILISDIKELEKSIESNKIFS